MNTNFDFSFVQGCGENKRTIVKANNRYYLGCFKGNYESSRRAIIKKYKDHNNESLLNDYLEKLDLLRGGGQSMEEFDWESDSWILPKYCPPLLKEFNDKIDWGSASYFVKHYCPEYMQYKPEDI